MARITRKKLARVIEAVALSLAGLDLLVYLAAARPLASAVASKQQEFSASRHSIRASELRLAKLSKSLTELPSTDEQVKQFLSDHVPPRRRGFSRAAGLVRQITQDSGVQLTAVSYRLETEGKEPLQRLGVQVNVRGPFQSLLHFTHALETAKDFVLVRGLALQPGEGGALTLRLVADLYVTP
jgi:Tfp pilus assembly protein PilO